MPAHRRRGRNDGLYQAHLHRRLDRQEVYQEIFRPPTLEELYARAYEAKKNKARLTFVPPDMLMDLIEIRDAHKRLKARVDGVKEEHGNRSG
jgi:hypothetical protein